jgi:large subunit ribosomal protein L21
MFAIVETGGKQYKVTVGQELEVEKLERNIGDKIKLNVLMLADGDVLKAGNPYVVDAVCEAEIVGHGKGDKIVVYKYKAKKNQRKKQGHRQPYTKIKILSIK